MKISRLKSDKKLLYGRRFTMENVHYNVSGMANSQSKTQLHNALEKMQGVQQIAIDLSRGTVEVEYNSPASSEQIKACIENTGYSVE